MLIPVSYAPNKYIPYWRNTYDMSIGDNMFDFYNDDYTYESGIQNGIFLLHITIMILVQNIFMMS